MIQGEEMQQAIKVLAQLPGFGQRSARRALLHLLIHKDRKMAPLIQAMIPSSPAGCVAIWIP